MSQNMMCGALQVRCCICLLVDANCKLEDYLEFRLDNGVHFSHH